jgi:hypothetical protein
MIVQPEVLLGRRMVSKMCFEIDDRARNDLHDHIRALTGLQPILRILFAVVHPVDGLDAAER